MISWLFLLFTESEIYFNLYTVSNHWSIFSTGSDFEWTPHKVELALWTNKTAMKMGLNIDAAISAKRKETKKKTKDGDHDDVENSDDEIRRKAEKPRTK